MAKYKKKPVVIEAVQYTKHNKDKLIEFLGLSKEYNLDVLIIKTLEGDMKASYGDYIIKGVKGEFYPCKPDIFKETYEEVKEEETIIESIMVLIEKEVKLQLEKYPFTTISHFNCYLNPKMVEQLREEVMQLSGKRIVELKSINIQGITVEFYSFTKLENLKDGEIYLYPDFTTTAKIMN